MTGGLIQLAAIGAEDLFLTQDPQITFFKVVYRRHTNFSTEIIPQDFAHTPNFGTRVTCILSRNGDLIRKMYLVIELPSVPYFLNGNNQIDNIAKFAWVKRIGYGIINNIEVEIGNESIDKQYGDWLNIWHELTITRNKFLDEMLGNVKELINFTNGKQSYTLYIPLQFWFNRFTGLALPIISLQYHNVQINLELNQLQSCYILTPTNSINIINDFVNFKYMEYLTQTVNGVTSIARYVAFDIITKTLYFWRITDNGFLSITDTSADPLEPDGSGGYTYSEYFIIGETSGFEAMPLINSIERVYVNNSVNINNLSLIDAFLLTEYVFLDDDERVRFYQSKHEYLIEQVLYNDQQTINGINQSFGMNFTQPCKEIFWVSQLSLVLENRINDIFNYTNNVNSLIGTNIILSETILFNGQYRLTVRPSQYFSYIQIYQNHDYSAPEGINVYSFALYPEKHQPSCTANLSKIDNITLQLNVNSFINYSYTAALRIYCTVYNIFRVAHGISGLVFSNDT